MEKDTIYDLEIISDLNNEPVIPELTENLIYEAANYLRQILHEKQLQLQDSAFDDIVGWYSKMVSRMTNNLIMQRYSSYFLTIHPFWRPKTAPPGDSAEGSERHILDNYIEWEMEGNLFSDNGPYPELSRMLVLAKKNWVNAVTEFLERLVTHITEIGDLIAVDYFKIEDISSIKFGISDSHDDGRTAAIVSVGRQKFIYKPRSLDGEYGWNTIVQELLNMGLSYTLLLPRILRYEGYGFMEFVSSDNCDNAADVKICYEKYGAILAIAHAFGTYDLHHENIIVHKDCPIVIDAEPLFRCMLENSEQGENRLRLDKSISLEDLNSSESVMDIGILPHTLMSHLDADEKKNVDYLVGALYPFGIEPTKDYVACGRGSNNLQLSEKKFKASHFPNLPYWEGKPHFPIDNLDSIEKGFNIIHTFLLNNRNKIIYQSPLFDKLKNLKIRLLLRPTMQYGLIYLRSLSVQLLTSKEKRRDKIIEDLHLVGKLRLDNMQRIEQLEVESILNGDIPRFEVISQGTEAYETNLLLSPIDMAKARFERLSSDERELQIVSIREIIKDRAQILTSSQNRSIEPSAQQKHALEIISSIMETTRWKDDTPYWTYTAYAPGIGCTMVHADRESLYDGSLGTAVAIAEAAKISGNTEWFKIAKALFNPLLKNETPSSIYRGGGMARGLGGLVYGILRIAETNNDEELLNLALNLAIKHADFVIEKDELDEVLHGRAGFLLSMIALYKRYPSEKLENVLEKVADILIKRAVAHPKGGMCWKVLDGHSLPNISHGTSGISMALARWYKLSNSSVAKDIVFGALDYDNSFWETNENGWIDARIPHQKDEQKTTWTWCNGRTGGVLARMAIYDALGLSFEDGFVNKAIQANDSDILLEAAPGLCCGTAGLIDSLTKINELYPQFGLQKRIDRASNLITLHSPSGHYSNLTAGLFTGTAGLAFALMRNAEPDAVKSLLWFE